MGNQALIKLNAVTITKEEIETVASEISKYQPEKFNADAFCSFVTSRFFNGDTQKADAVLFRLSAFAMLSKNNDLLTWSSEIFPDNSISIHSAIIAAAALEPLIYVKGIYGFDKESFLKRVLEQAKPKGSIQ